MNTLKVGTLEKSFADWHILKPLREQTNQSADSFGFDIDAAFDATDDIPFGTGVEVFIQRTQNLDGSFTGGTRHFVGWRVNLLRFASPEMEQLGYKFAGPWEWFFERLTFSQSTKSWDTVNHVEITETKCLVNLGISATGAHLTIYEQAEEIIQCVMDQMTVELGAPNFIYTLLLPSVYFPQDQVNNITCGEALRRLMRWVGSTTIFFTYTSDEIALGIATRDQLTPVTLPIIGAQGTEFERRDDMVPPAINLEYRITANYSGSPYTSIRRDLACATGYIDATGAAHGDTYANLFAAGVKFGAVRQTYNFVGPSYSSVKATIVCETFSPSSLAWWTAHCAELGQVDPTTLAIDTTSVAYDQSLADESLVYVLLQGQIAPWMSALTQTLTVSAKFSGTIKATDGRVAHVWSAVPKQVQVVLVSLPSGTYSNTALVDVGEAIPFGLAKQVWDLESVPQYEGVHRVTEDEISGVVKLYNVLNMTGGLTEWQTMNAQVQRLTFDYDKATTVIHVGPATHLGAGDLIARLQSNRQPRWSLIFGNDRTSSSVSVDLTLGSTTAKGNTTSGQAVQSVHTIMETDNTGLSGNEGKLGLIKFDAAGRQILMQGAPWPVRVCMASRR